MGLMEQVDGAEVLLLEAFWQQVHADLRHSDADQRMETYYWLETPTFALWAELSGMEDPERAREVILQASWPHWLSRPTEADRRRYDRLKALRETKRANEEARKQLVMA